MLKKIKATYFIKIIFSYIDEKQELKLVKFNKSLQKKFDISINNYIHFQGKYIIYESNGKGKEYNFDDRLIFEGEYLNGERNGKGKEYFEGIIYINEGFEKTLFIGDLIFEGEYLKGKRNGKGKEYYYNGKIKFEGEFLDGKKLVGTEYL